MSSIYVWINDNKMYMWTKQPPQQDWCDSFIEVTDVDFTKYFEVSYNESTKDVSIQYLPAPEEESKLPFLM